MPESPGRPEVEGVAAEQRQVGDRLLHHKGDVWEVIEADLPGDGSWGTGVDAGMCVCAGDIRIRCIAGREEGRTTRVHDEYVVRSFKVVPPEGSGRGVAGEYTEADEAVEVRLATALDQIVRGLHSLNRGGKNFGVTRNLEQLAQAALDGTDPFVSGKRVGRPAVLEAASSSSSGSPLTVDAVRADERRRTVTEVVAWLRGYGRRKVNGAYIDPPHPASAPVSQLADAIAREFPSPGAVQHTREDGGSDGD